MRKGFYVLWTLIFVFSCGSITKEEFERRTAALENRIAQLEERQRILEEKNMKAEGRMDNLSENIARIRLDLERLRLEKSSQAQLSRTQLPEPAQKDSVVQREPQTPQTQREDISQTTEEFQKEYEAALNLYNLRQLNQARDKFIEFIRKYPRTPLTDNAYLWLGVVYRDLGELNKAEAIWLTLVERCQRKEMVDCNKAPSALIQLARLYEQSGNEQKAKEFYEAILRDYPASEEASIARSKLGR